MGHWRYNHGWPWHRVYLPAKVSLNIHGLANYWYWAGTDSGTFCGMPIDKGLMVCYLLVRTKHKGNSMQGQVPKSETNLFLT